MGRSFSVQCWFGGYGTATGTFVRVVDFAVRAGEGVCVVGLNHKPLRVKSMREIETHACIPVSAHLSVAARVLRFSTAGNTATVKNKQLLAALLASFSGQLF